MTLRDNLASQLSGGPPFRVQPDRLIVEVTDNGGLSAQAENFRKERKDVLEESPVDLNVASRVQGELKRLGFNVKRLDNLGVIVAEAPRLDNVLDELEAQSVEFGKDVITDVQKARKRARRQGSKTIMGGWTPLNMEFKSVGDVDYEESESGLEARLRNELSDISLANPVTEAVQNIEGVANAELSFTRTTFGPLNLNIDIDELDSVLSKFQGDSDGKSATLPTLADMREKVGVDDAWGETTGEGAVIAIFDTSFCREFLDSDRVLDTFSADSVESAYSDPEEGHGTMCAVAAAGNVEDGAPFNGVAKDADLLLARITDSDGALSQTEEAWDWLAQKTKEIDRPIISSHSYGIPLCSGRQMGLCNSTTNKVVRAMNKRTDHQSFHAAGNEAIYCGHRLSGPTNGILGTNSDPSTITVGANRFDLTDAQPYSSHGFGTCSGIDKNPKPDVSCLIPSAIPYGCDVKDMSSGVGGSSGGTSLATPIVAGVAGLISSVNGNARRGEIEDILEMTAKQPRATQVNTVLGYDARFGRGQVQAGDAVEEAISRIP